MKKNFLILTLVSALILSGCTWSSPTEKKVTPPVCDNDGLCEKGETEVNCPGDCYSYTAVLFEEDFDSGYPDWLEAGKWAIEDGALTNAVDGIYTGIGEPGWTDYVFEVKVKLEKGATILYVRMADERGYGVWINENSLKLWKDLLPVGIDLAEKAHDFALGQFHNLRIKAVGNNLKVYVEGDLKIDYTDTNNPQLTGRPGVEVLGQDKVYFDDIRVMGREASKQEVEIIDLDEPEVLPKAVTEPLDGKMLYKNTYYGFEVEYPDYWIQEEIAGNITGIAHLIYQGAKITVPALGHGIPPEWIRKETSITIDGEEYKVHEFSLDGEVQLKLANFPFTLEDGRKGNFGIELGGEISDKAIEDFDDIVSSIKFID